MTSACSGTCADEQTAINRNGLLARVGRRIATGEQEVNQQTEVNRVRREVGIEIGTEDRAARILIQRAAGEQTVDHETEVDGIYPYAGLPQVIKPDGLYQSPTHDEHWFRSKTEAKLYETLNDFNFSWTTAFFDFLVAKGKAIFENPKYCMSCHLATAGGAIGPNLTDEFWIYGNTPMDIYTTIQKGRPGGMPEHASKIGQVGVREAAAYVLSLRNTNVSGGKKPEPNAKKM